MCLGRMEGAFPPNCLAGISRTCEGKDLTPSSMQRDSNWDLFPTCSNQQGYEGNVSLAQSLSLTWVWTLVAATIRSQFSRWPWLLLYHLTCSQCLGTVPTSTPSPSFGYQELLSGGCIGLQSCISKRNQSCALIFWGHLLGTADILQFLVRECSWQLPHWSWRGKTSILCGFVCLISLSSKGSYCPVCSKYSYLQLYTTLYSCHFFKCLSHHKSACTYKPEFQTVRSALDESVTTRWYCSPPLHQGPARAELLFQVSVQKFGCFFSLVLNLLALQHGQVYLKKEKVLKQYF